MKLNPALIHEAETDLVLRPRRAITLPTDVTGVVVYVVAYPVPNDPGAPLVERITTVAEQLCAAFTDNPRADKPKSERRLHTARRKSATRRR